MAVFGKYSKNVENDGFAPHKVVHYFNIRFIYSGLHFVPFHADPPLIVFAADNQKLWMCVCVLLVYTISYGPEYTVIHIRKVRTFLGCGDILTGPHNFKRLSRIRVGHLVVVIRAGECIRL